MKQIFNRPSKKMLHFLSTTIFQLKKQTAAVEMSLLPKVKALSIEEFEKFKWLLQFTYFRKSLPNISWSTLECTETAYQLVVLMEHKPQSLEVTEEVLMDMRI
uniref:Pyrin domain-containing protein n=1 Tax=Gasterosteus aculeatus TaxID=69293 RepID=G3PFE8_GASAC